MHPTQPLSLYIPQALGHSPASAVPASATTTSTPRCMAAETVVGEPVSARTKRRTGRFFELQENCVVTREIRRIRCVGLILLGERCNTKRERVDRCAPPSLCPSEPQRKTVPHLCQHLVRPKYQRVRGTHDAVPPPSRLSFRVVDFFLFRSVRKKGKGGPAQSPTKQAMRIYPCALVWWRAYPGHTSALRPQQPDLC